uniref:hypothetical protein n=1 Tax=Lactobacillaceae TaxID=33958 RepID=UPI001CDD5F3B|nr:MULTISPECIES: hypothetical protein [Lactobacillaceae]
MVDPAFSLGRDCKAVALKHNSCMKRGTRKSLLWVSIFSELFEYFLLGSSGDFYVVVFLFLS